MDLSTGRRELHRFRPGQSCDECNSRRWYTDSGFRYCENGHLIESYIPFELEDDGGGNSLHKGHVTRKKREVHEREARQLTGVDARELFLECLQLLLRKQLAWLRQKAAVAAEEEQQEQQEQAELSRPPSPSLSSSPPRPMPLSSAASGVAAAPSPPITALEAVVRDLWDLRIRYFQGLTIMVLADDDARSRSYSRSYSRSRSRSRAPSQAPSHGGSESDGRTVYSSQIGGASDTEGSGTGGDGSGRRQRRRRARARSARRWDAGPDEQWNVPSVMETLALCYLGGVLLRLPYRIGDFYCWAKNDQIPFLQAVMRDRLPATYQLTLTTKRTLLVGGELHEAVLSLVRGFAINNELRFPGLNVPPILWRWTRDLGLPIDVYVGVLELSRLSQEDYCYPMDRTKLLQVDYPDILLLATTIMVTKLLHPFRVDGTSDGGGGGDGGDERDSSGRKRKASSRRMCMDWTRWQAVFDESDKLSPLSSSRPRGRPLERSEMSRLRPEDAWTLTTDQVDDYLDWHQEVRLTEKEDLRYLLRLFPLQEIQPRPPVRDEPEEAIDARYRRIQETCLVARYDTADRPRERKAKKTEPEDPEALRRLRNHPLDHYRHTSDLPPTALAFYSRAAYLAGLTVRNLVREVGRIERRWVEWNTGYDKRPSVSKRGGVPRHGEHVDAMAGPSDDEDEDEGEDDGDEGAVAEGGASVQDAIDHVIGFGGVGGCSP